MPSEVKQQTEIVQCPDYVVEDASSLKGTYRRIVFNILNVLKETVNSGEIKLVYLASTIYEWCEIEQTLTGNETVDDVCIPITRNKNCFNPNLDLLLVIDAAFCKKQFSNDIRSYRTELRNFLDSTPIATFTEKVKSHCGTWNTSNSSSEVVVVIEVNRYYSKLAVSQINYLKTYIFGENSSIMVLQDIHQSVLTITYSMPAQFVFPVLSTVMKKIDLLRIIGVISIKIGDILLPIGDDIAENDMRICNLEQRQKSKLINRIYMYK